ncbi:DUF3768 domain-containing protein [Methylorubrum aminovorans]
MRDLNEAFRRSFSGGRVVLSDGVAAQPDAARAGILAAVRKFERFDADNDFYVEHDVGAVQVVEVRCL